MEMLSQEVESELAASESEGSVALLEEPVEAPEIPADNPMSMRTTTVAEAREEQAQQTPLDKRYQKLVDEVAEGWKGTNKQTLEFHYWMGSKANDLTENGRAKYGDASIEKFAKDLRDAGAIGVSASQIYRASRFNSKFGPDDLKRLIKDGWAWRNLVYLLADNIPANIRRRIVSKVENGEIDQRQVARALAEVMPDVVTRRKTRAPGAVFVRIVSRNKSYVTQLDQVGELVTKIGEYKPNARAPFKEKVDTLRTSLLELQGKLAERLAELNKLEF